MELETVLYRVEGPVAVISLNRIFNTAVPSPAQRLSPSA